MFQRWICFSLSLLGSDVLGRTEPLLPTVEGTIWEYAIAGTSGTGIPTSTLTVQIQGKEESKGKELVRFETLIGSDLAKTELLAVDERGLLCYERTLSNGKTVSFEPPQTLLPAALKVGAKWELDDSVAGSEMHQQFSIAAEENVVVPAGSFRAYRLHCEEPWPISTSIDRWFVPGTGLVKDITTTRGPTGRLLTRVTMVMTKFSIPATPPSQENVPPSVEVHPSTSPLPSPITIKLELAKAREGEAVTEFRSDVPNIFVRWSGENLPVDAEVRIAWIAEDVGEVAPPNFVVDETESTVTRPEFAARFTLSRPKDGWAPGKYRAELYLEAELKEKVNVTIRD